LDWGISGQMVKKSRTNVTHHRSNHLASVPNEELTQGSFDSLRSLRISAAGSDARKAPQDAGSVRLPIPRQQPSLILPQAVYEK